jgi:hypothetical protein
VATRYDAKSLNASGVQIVAAIKAQAELLAETIDVLGSREASIAKTHLETAVMFAVRAAAVELSEPDVEQPFAYVAHQPVEAVSVEALCKSVRIGVLACPQWLLDRMNAGTLLVTETTVRLEMPNKLEGAAGWNDWIVRFADGTILPVRAEVFTALFGVQPRAEDAR